MFNYLIDDSGALTGPVEFPLVPGIGVQLPSNAVTLSIELALAAVGGDLLHLLRVLLLGYDVELEEHGGVLLTAELGALPGVITDALRDDLHAVGAAGDHVGHGDDARGYTDYPALTGD